MSFADLPLFAPSPPQRPTTHEVELSRVSERIAQTILEFAKPGRTFHADELRSFVSERCKVAPASADRVLRSLRQKGLVKYRVLSRSKSLYEVMT